MKPLNNASLPSASPKGWMDADRQTSQPTRDGKRRMRLAAILLAFSLALPVLANEEAYYHGTICQPAYGSRNIVQHNLYGIYNASTTATATVECAVPMYGRDNSGTFYYATVSVYDRNTSKNVSCTLRRLRNTDGGIYFQLSKSSSGGGPGTGLQQLSFFEPGTPVAGAGYWHLECSLPPKQSGNVSQILGITLDYQAPQ